MLVLLVLLVVLVLLVLPVLLVSLVSLVSLVLELPPLCWLEQFKRVTVHARQRWIELDHCL